MGGYWNITWSSPAHIKGLYFEGTKRKACRWLCVAQRRGSNRSDRSLSLHSDSAEAQGERLKTLDSFHRLLWHLAGKVELVFPHTVTNVAVICTSFPALAQAVRDWTEARTQGRLNFFFFTQQTLLTETLVASYFNLQSQRNFVMCSPW